MMEVEQRCEQVTASIALSALVDECSAITNYRTLRDSLPRRLANLLKCRCVLLYQRVGETLQFASGTYDDKPGWSSALLAIARINPISLNSDVPEACAWRERHAIAVPVDHPALVAVPLIYRQRGVGVLVAVRSKDEEKPHAASFWTSDEVQVLEAAASVVALLLENTRLLERDRERIHELSLLNSISSQMNCSLYEVERIRSIVIQRTREISAADLCELIEPATPIDAVEWISPRLRELLFQRFNGQGSPLPFVIERPGDAGNTFASEQLPTNIKTFFAIPLLSGRATGRHALRRSGVPHDTGQEHKVLGIVVGAYYRAWKLRHEEIVLLQVLASQAAAVLENMQLMAEVVEARNEARKLLRQVVDDQRSKELILESIPSGLVTIDMRGCVTAFNRAAEAILGYHPYEVLGQPLHTFLDLRSFLASDRAWSLPSAPSMPQHEVLYTLIHPSELRSGTITMVDRRGHDLVLDVDVLPLYDDLGEQRGALITFTDVTSVHRLEEEKRRLDRLASLGEMAANVAHEVRNPLASIKTSIQMLLDDLAGEEAISSPSHTGVPESAGLDAEGQHSEDSTKADCAQESVSIVLKEVERLDAIVRDLLLFAKPRQLHCTKCDLVALSEHVLQLIQVQSTEANVVVHRVYNDVPPLWADMAQMEQVLFNLYMNAVQAMPDGGVLTISCRVIAGDSESVQSSLRSEGRFSPLAHRSARKGELPVQQWMELSVSDTGVGIPPDQLERIFQPFYTTKAHGIGLGLPITRRLVEDHGGYMQAESRFGYGATLSVRLPLTSTITRVLSDESEGL